MKHAPHRTVISLLMLVAASCGGGGSGGGGGAPPPTAGISASVGYTQNPSAAMLGTDVMLQWGSTNATTCVASGDWSGTLSTSGQTDLTPPKTGTYVYDLSCSGPGGTASTSYTLQVGPSITLTFSPQSVPAGASATLSWSTSGAATCSASGAWTGTQATSGQAPTSPVIPGQYDYALTCADSTGIATSVTAPSLMVSPNGFSNTALAANTSGPARNTDPSLLGPWGIAFPAKYAAVVANNQGNTSTSYDGTGGPQSVGTAAGPLAVQLPAGAGGAPFNPTGVVVAPAGVMVTAGGKSGPAQLIYVGESGMIAAWAPTVDPANAIAVYADSGGAVYKSLAVAGNVLYAADFHNNKIDVFDLNFVKQSGYPFSDPALPAGYAPYGLYVFPPQGTLYVAYAMQLAPANRDAVTGAGLGVINVFHLNGTRSARLTTGGALNAPAGMSSTPSAPFNSFGLFSEVLLVANAGDGRINGFDLLTGASAGALSDASGTPLVIPGLHDIAVGNRYANQPDFTLFYTAGANNTGLFGRIDYGAAPRFHAPPVLSVTIAGSSPYDVTVGATTAAGIAWLDLYEPDGSVYTRDPGVPPFNTQFVCFGSPCPVVSATVTDVDGNIATLDETPP